MDQTVAPKTRPAARLNRPLILSASLMATFMAAVESSIVATAMPTIVADLGGFQFFSWVFAAYLLAMAVTIPLYGRFADIYGRKRVFFFGAGVFLLGTTLCGLAHSMMQLVAFRALQGMGAGAIQPIAMTVLGDIYTPAERAKIQGFTSSVFGISAILGPALGAFIVEHMHWSLIFWVNLPIGAASIAMYALFLPEQVLPRKHQIDYAGAALLTIGVGAVLLTLVQAATLDARSIVLMVAVAVVAFVLLVIQERRAPEPIVPYKLWRNRVIALANLGIFGTGSAMMGVSAFLPAYVQGVMGRSPGTAGFALGCQSVSWMFATFIAGRLMIRTSYRVSAAIGGVALLTGGGLFLLMTPDSGVGFAATASLVMGVGMGFCNPAFLVSIQASVDWTERGVATGANMFMRILGQSTGASLFGAVVNFGVAQRLPGAGDAVNRLLEPNLRQTLGADEIHRLTAAVAASVHEVYFIVTAIAAATLTIALCFPAGLKPTHTSSGRR